MQGIFEIVRRVFGGSRSKRQCRIILTTNPEGPLHLQLWTLVATLPLSRKKWKAAAQKFIILGVPMTGYGRTEPVNKDQHGMPSDRIHRRPAIRSGEESVFCSTALLRRGFISADFLA
jgi:hypothetical protein